MSRTPRLPLLALALVAAACQKDTPPPPAETQASVSAAPSAAPAAAKHDALERDKLNQLAARLNLPLYWAADRNKDRSVDPDEVATLLFYPTDTVWAEKGAFTPAFEDAYQKLVKASKDAAPTDAREKLALAELDNAAPTLVESDLAKLSSEDKTFVAHMRVVTKLVDDIFAKQMGASTVAARVGKDTASQSIFRRNWGARCVTPASEKDPACSAIPGAPKPISDAYPEAMQADPKFCEAIEKNPDSKKLLEPFVVVRDGGGGKLTAVPYNEVYKEPMAAVAKELRAAEKDLKDPNEAPLRAYLAAAATSFETNDWRPADEAWSKMNAQNSRWYLRVAPDEVYWEPCSHKAGFHVTFARINPESLKWQEKLTPVQQEMEDKLAALIGAPYKSRKVTFHLPDFIDIVWNAGDARAPLGATIGQSLPNWGPVAAEGRGRTVAMSNLYADPDSMAVRRKKAESLFTKESASTYVDDPAPSLLTTILHEAMHNLGPAHEYKYQGKTDAAAFGGELSSMLEELKAQTGGLWLIDFAHKKGLITDEQAKQTYTDALVWALNHISKGMYSGAGRRKPYSQLSAIQVGFLLDEKAITFDEGATAANGTDKGAFSIQLDKLPAAIDKLMKVVGAIKASNDKAGAEALAKKYVDGTIVPHKVIAERALRFPQPSFVYSVKL